MKPVFISGIRTVNNLEDKMNKLAINRRKMDNCDKSNFSSGGNYEETKFW
jgi:hypothetical protein